MNGFEFKEIANSFKSLADKLPDFSISENKVFPFGGKESKSETTFPYVPGKESKSETKFPDFVGNEKLETKLPDFGRRYLSNNEVSSNIDSVEQDNSEKNASSESENRPRNSYLEGKAHPVTGVEFVRKTVETDTGEMVEGVFPKFESVHDVQLPPELEKEKDGVQFRECKKQLKNWVEINPELAKEKFSEEQLVDISNNRTPDGYTWHHSEEKGKMELIDSVIHAKTGHDGGKKIWGGGDENR